MTCPGHNIHGFGDYIRGKVRLYALGSEYAADIPHQVLAFGAVMVSDCWAETEATMAARVAAKAKRTIMSVLKGTEKSVGEDEEEVSFKQK